MQSIRYLSVAYDAVTNSHKFVGLQAQKVILSQFKVHVTGLSSRTWLFIKTGIQGPLVPSRRLMLPEESSLDIGDLQEPMCLWVSNFTLNFSEFFLNAALNPSLLLWSPSPHQTFIS